MGVVFYIMWCVVVGVPHDLRAMFGLVGVYFLTNTIQHYIVDLIKKESK